MLESGGGPPASFSQDPQVWFEITADNRVRLFLSKVEMGQGIHTALAQIGAEELGVAWEQIDVVQGSTHTGPADAGGTGASNSVSSVYEPLRTVAATLRELLREEAALALNQSVASLAVREGIFSGGGKQISYGEIVAHRQARGGGEWTLPEDAPALKAVADFEVIGQSKPRLDIPAKVTGAAVYGYDARAEGMLYGAVLRPPTIGARITRSDRR